ncbi:nuclease domain-containing protein [Bacillus sp. MRMR6]|uniref:nuclease domain-containing protein n=1 Tax=Bacillus sp. MRMR6 TaxID=1928617 RepID=UPI0009531F17|nr:nuclease domain-containing protein [Bacillus sp. MRMR6]OLS37735.1 hypothetical protein BTR25_15575 [Bacillus sp. MRMR6]
MQVELYMIKVWYNHRGTPQKELLPISSINIGDKIAQKNKQEWVIPNHYRSQSENFMRQIGIRFPDKINNVTSLSISSPDGKFRSTFVYYPKENIWFEPTRFSNKKRKGYYLFEESSILTGLTNAGTANLNYEENGHYKDFATIHFVPSSLPIDDYEEMVADLYRIREDIVRDDRNIARVGINSSKVVMDLQEQLKKLKIAIKQINASPHSTLELQTTKKKPQNHGRFDFRMEIEQYINPGKPIYRSRELKPVVATFENMLIKQMLGDLVQYATAMGSKEITTKSLLNSVLNEREVYFRKSDLEIQRLLGSVDKVEDKKTYNQVHNKLNKDMQQYLDEENSIRGAIKVSADYNNIPSLQSNTEYIELILEMNGPLTSNNQYYHRQSNQGLAAQLKYDRRQRHLRVRNYVIKNQPKIPNGSYFGTIFLSSEHVQSHLRFYKAFCEESQLESINQPMTIQICGMVRKQPNGIDTVSTTRQFDDYLDYTFDFVYISSIQVDGIDIDIPSDKKSLNAFLDSELPIMMNNADQSEDAFMRLKQLEKLQSLTNQMEEIHSVSKKYDELKEVAEELLNLNLFSKLELKERLPVKPTQLFLHNPTYRVAWQAMQRIKYELSASLYVQQNQRQVSTGKVEYIFEVWTLYKIIHVLTMEMGWKLEGNKNVTACLDQYMVAGSEKGLQNFSATLYWQHWELEIYYEPKINLPFENYLTPDFVFKFKKNGSTMGLVILDAKYRNYESQGIEHWVKDINDIAITKYGNMQSIDPKWQFPIMASGILHSDVKISEDAEDKYNPYHVMYNETLFNTNLSEEKAHKYGSIYMIPSKTYIFKNWFRLIMEYHLGEHKVCWNCGESKEVQERQLLTQYGYPKYYYTCHCCNEFWVKVHCRSNRHKIIKHMNNYHLQVENRRKWWVICPSCGDGRPAQQNSFTTALFNQQPVFIDFDDDLPW